MERYVHQSSIWSGGLIGVNIIILQNILSLTKLDTTVFIAIIAIAFAIPILTCNILVNLRRVVGTKTPIHEILFYSLGIIASLTGIAFTFLHISWIPFAIFLGSLVISALVYFTSVRYNKKRM